jgi:alcohol dehydrogenase
MADRGFFHGPFRCPEAGGWALGDKIDGTRAEYVRVPYADISTLPGSVRRKS